MGGRKVAGMVAIVLGVAIGAFDFLSYWAHHPKRGPVILVVCALLLIFGIILMVARGGGASKTQAPGA